MSPVHSLLEFEIFMIKLDAINSIVWNELARANGITVNNFFFLCSLEIHISNSTVSREKETITFVDLYGQ